MRLIYAMNTIPKGCRIGVFANNVGHAILQFTSSYWFDCLRYFNDCGSDGNISTFTSNKITLFSVGFMPSLLLVLRIHKECKTP